MSGIENQSDTQIAAVQSTSSSILENSIILPPLEEENTNINIAKIANTIGNEICSGTERENFKPSTTGTESIRTDKKDTTDNATHV